jgi:hypothetical protein
MGGTRAVRFDREVLFAFLTMDGETIRLRVSDDECDRLGLTAGKEVGLAIEDGGQHPAHVVGVKREPPFAWVTVEFPARSRAAA